MSKFVRIVGIGQPPPLRCTFSTRSRALAQSEIARQASALARKAEEKARPGGVPKGRGAGSCPRSDRAFRPKPDSTTRRSARR